MGGVVKGELLETWKGANGKLMIYGKTLDAWRHSQSIPRFSSNIYRKRGTIWRSAFQIFLMYPHSKKLKVLLSFTVSLYVLSFSNIRNAAADSLISCPRTNDNKLKFSDKLNWQVNVSKTSNLLHSRRVSCRSLACWWASVKNKPKRKH